MHVRVYGCMDACVHTCIQVQYIYIYVYIFYVHTHAHATPAASVGTVPHLEPLQCLLGGFLACGFVETCGGFRVFSFRDLRCRVAVAHQIL